MLYKTARSCVFRPLEFFCGKCALPAVKCPPIMFYACKFRHDVITKVRFPHSYPLQNYRIRQKSMTLHGSHSEPECHGKQSLAEIGLHANRTGPLPDSNEPVASSECLSIAYAGQNTRYRKVTRWSIQLALCDISPTNHISLCMPQTATPTVFRKCRARYWLGNARTPFSDYNFIATKTPNVQSCPFWCMRPSLNEQLTFHADSYPDCAYQTVFRKLLNYHI